MDKSEREFQKDLALNQINANLFITLGILLMATSTSWIIFTVSLNYDRLIENNIELPNTIFELSLSFFGIMAWILFAIGTGIVCVCYVYFRKVIEKMDNNFKDIL